ncbi:hypothetical protein BDV25DRAFT_18395 [Aspergillus avenaceus]|uniref:Luciferase domain-containing protein n=1 Tax=Aspergillus avenaceus TaxID=36643 RepID=A0A5N6U563_ASPAV|nr:hypothetical protein BDV25DRAFT_18395 [Aspergillus avenaceus]
MGPLSSHGFQIPRGIDIPSGLPPRLGPMMVAGLFLGTIGWAVYDFRDWVDFGTGGTPPTFRGWLSVNRLRVVRAIHYLGGDDLQNSARVPLTGPQFLSSPLPQRSGGPPTMKPRPLPQRQCPEPIEQRAQETLNSLLSEIHAQYPDRLQLGKSKVEGGAADAIFARAEAGPWNPQVVRLGYELAHIHSVDRSLHIFISPADARTVIDARWGRRFANPSLTPPGWIMVYAPRNTEEVEQVRQILKAVLQWSMFITEG